MMKFKDFIDRIEMLAEDPGSWRVNFVHDAFRVRDSNGTWWPMDECNKCGKKFSDSDEVHFDGAECKVYCSGCARKIKPRHEAGADQSSLGTVIQLPLERGQIRE